MNNIVFRRFLILAFILLSAGSLPARRIALLGDSMTWIGGDSCENPRGWSHYLKESGIADQIDVYARSGATWTNGYFTNHNPSYYSELLHPDNVIYNQTVRLIEKQCDSNVAPDIIIVFAGANDAWFAKSFDNLFKIDSLDILRHLDDSGDQAGLIFPTTLFGSVSLVCDMLKEKFPFATLIAVTPLQMTKTDAETIHKVSDIIEQAASAKGCIVLRADKEVGISHDEESKAFKFTSDGVHTNPAGARLLADFILPHISGFVKDKVDYKHD